MNEQTTGGNLPLTPAEQAAILANDALITSLLALLAQNSTYADLYKEDLVQGLDHMYRQNRAALARLRQ